MATGTGSNFGASNTHAPELGPEWGRVDGFKTGGHCQYCQKYHSLSTQAWREGEICELIFLDFKVEGISCP